MRYMRPVTWLAVLAIVAIAAVGCSSPKNETGTTPPAPSNTSGQTPAPSNGPKAGGQVVIPLVGDPVFNPHHPNHFAESVMVTRVMYNGLTRPGKDLKPGPDLAESWETSADGKTWTFKLRANVKWHDGKPFTADDVVFTFMKVILNPAEASGSARNFANVQEVKKVDDTTVQFVLKAPMASLPSYLGYNAGILPKHALDGKEVNKDTVFNKEKPVGTGAYKLQEFKPGQFVTLVRNDDYFLGKPLLDKVVYRVVPDSNTQIAQTLSGELSLIIVDNPANVERLKSNNQLRVTVSPQINFYWIGPNLSQERFQDVKVRQAMAHSLDRKAMVDTLLKGYGQVATGPISPALSFYYTGDVPTYDYNVEKAKQLLGEAGWKDSNGDGIVDKGGQNLSFALTIPKVQQFEPLGAMIQQYYKAVGIDVKLDVQEFNSFVAKKLVPRDYDMVAGWWITPPDPDFFPYYHSSAAQKGNNAPLLNDPAIDKLLEDGLAKTKPEERKPIYTEFQKKAAADLSYIYLWWPQEPVALRSNIQGYPDGMNFRDALQYINEWWVK